MTWDPGHQTEGQGCILHLYRHHKMQESKRSQNIPLERVWMRDIRGEFVKVHHMEVFKNPECILFSIHWTDNIKELKCLLNKARSRDPLGRHTAIETISVPLGWTKAKWPYRESGGFYSSTI